MEKKQKPDKNLFVEDNIIARNSLRGKKSRAAGNRFELKVRKDLESKGWIVDKWTNNVELGEIMPELKGDGMFCGKLVPAKHKFRGMGIPMAIGTGFPDFIAFKYFGENKGGVGCPHCPVSNGRYTHILPYEIINGRFPDGHWENHNGKELYGHTMKIFENFGVEVKSNGYLDKEEKFKCKWLLDNHIFSKILIASKGKERGEIKYENFKK